MLSNNANLQFEIDSTTFTDPMIGGLAAGEYDLLITDADGCSTTRSFTIPEAPEFVVEIDSTTSNLIVCDGEMGAISFIGEGELSLFDFNAGSAIDTGSLFDIGTHELVAFNDVGCSDTISFEIEELIIGPRSTDLLPEILCPDETFSFSPSMLIGNAEEDWEFALDGVSRRFDEFIDIGSGVFMLEVITTEGCMELFNIAIDESFNGATHADMLFGTVGDTLSITLDLLDPGSVEQVMWTISNDFICQDELCATVDVSIDQSETISYDIVDSLGCMFSGTIMLEAIPLDSMMMDTMDMDMMSDTTMMDTTSVDTMSVPDLPIDTTQQVPTQPNNLNFYIPNAIRAGSPVNGNLCVTTASEVFTSARLQVYDRWGGLVVDETGPISNRQFCITDIQIWDELTVGVYVYTVKMNGVENEMRDHGTVTLVR